MGQPLTPGQPPRSTSQRSTLSSSLSLPTPPQGWPIGSYPTYAEAQRAVDYLSDEQFPVENVTIVGVNLMQVERVTGRLSWPKVLGGGMLSGAWLGLFIGLVLGMFSTNLAGSLVVGLTVGLVFGLVTAAVPYAMTRGTRDSHRRCSWSRGVTTCCASRPRPRPRATCWPN
ncbi:putative transmembrane protein [Mycobacteroides abscessus]|nr:putative transmembrane protein [Mycobacteroides abscessus]